VESARFAHGLSGIAGQVPPGQGPNVARSQKFSTVWKKVFHSMENFRKIFHGMEKRGHFFHSVEKSFPYCGKIAEKFSIGMENGGAGGHNYEWGEWREWGRRGGGIGCRPGR
jgi:hypothetical protein